MGTTNVTSLRARAAAFTLGLTIGAGSIVGGSLILDPTTDSTPGITRGETDVMLFEADGDVKLNSGSLVINTDECVKIGDTEVECYARVSCTATGGLASYAYCNWTEPTTNGGSGSVVDLVEIQFGDSPAVIGIDVTIGSSLTTSGSTAFHANLTNVSSSTGGTVTFSTGATLVPDGDTVRAVTLTDPTSAHTANMLVRYRTHITDTD